jgi:hypothetical protein
MCPMWILLCPGEKLLFLYSFEDPKFPIGIKLVMQDE